MSIGNLIGGFVTGYQQQQEMQVRNDYIKAQKKILDAQIKATEMEEQWWGQQSPEIQKIRFLPKETQSVAMMMAGMQGLPNIMGGTAPAAPAAPPPPSSYTEAISQQQTPEMSPAAQPPAAQPPAMGGGAPDMASSLLMRSQWKKMFGIDPGEVNMRTIAGQGGMPVTQGFDIFGRPTGTQYPEAVKPEAIEQVDPKTGQTRKVWINPFQQGQGMPMGTPQGASQGQGAGLVTKPAEVETVTTQYGGVTYEQDINKVTRQPMGAPRVKEEKYGGKGGESQKTIYQANVEKIVIPAIKNLVNNSITVKNGKPELTWSARVQGTAPKYSQKLGGQIANDAVKIAYALLRPESGAVINEDELFIKISSQMPKLFTESEYGIEQFKAMGTLVDAYLSGIDPEYTPIAHTLIEQAINAKIGKGGMKTPPKLGGKGGPSKGKDYDYEYVPGQGIR